MTVSKTRNTLFAFALALGIGAGALPAGAQQAPRPFTLILPAPPANTVDSTGRLFASAYEARFGQKIAVENRPGAGTYAGSAYVARSAPDGQILLMNASTALHANAFVKGLEVDVGETLAPVAILAVTSPFLIASATVPAKNLGEFVAFAKKRPKKLNAGVIANTAAHLYTLMFLQAAGIDLVPIPYINTPISALLEGDVHLFFGTVSEFISPHLASGKMIALAAATPGRFPLIPQIRTAKEQGINFDAPSTEFGVFAPKGLSPDLALQLNRRVYTAMNTPEVSEQLKARGFVLPAPETPDVLAAKFSAEVADVRAAARRFGITPQ